MNNKNKFIPRKFKNIETGETVDFETVINSSTISVILGEPASGKTYQLKEYTQNNKNSILLKSRHVTRNKTQKKQILLFDSIDEALISYPNIKDDLIDYIEENQDKKFIITCRYLEWKKYFEKELKELDDELKIYEIIALSKKEIDNLLKEEDRRDFWKFIDNNHLESLLKNIMIIFHLIENFRSYDNNSNYVNIYERIVKEYITKIGEDREEEDTNRDLNELVLIASSLATYMILNRLSNISSTNLKKVASECYKIDGQSIIADDLTAVLKTALFEKKGDEFTFFHKSIQEYLTAYFINYKELDFKTIKEIFANKLRFFEEFEEVIIYLTNMQPNLFNDFIEFDPFIFRRHPSLTKKQQEKLLSSIIDKIQNSEYLVWNKEYLFDNTTLTKFDKINDIYSLVKNRNIEKNDILLQYIMRAFVQNYSQKLEDFIFEILAKIKDKDKCREFISHSYNDNGKYNIRLFHFMKTNKLFNRNDGIAIELFYILAKEKFEIKNLVFLMKFLENRMFIKKVNLLSKENFCTIDNIKEMFNKYLFNIKINNQNIGYLAYLLFVYDSYEDDFIEKLITFCNENKIFFHDNEFYRYVFHKDNLFSHTPNRDKFLKAFLKVYFSNYINNIFEIQILINLYDIQQKDIDKMQKEYPFKDKEHFFQIFQLLIFLNKSFKEYKEFSTLEKKELKKIANKIKAIKNIKENDELINFCIRLYKNDFEALESIIFELLEYFINENKKCREYIRESYNNKYDYNLKLFDFMKNNNLFKFDNKNNIEEKLFVKLNFKIDKQLFLFQYISFDFFEKLEYIPIKNYKKWFDYFSENYNKELLENNSDYRRCLGWIACKLLKDYDDLNDTLLKKIILFFIKIKIKFKILEKGEYRSRSTSIINIIEKLSDTIPKEFWSIYFNDKIKNHEEIISFLKVYVINEKNLKRIVEKYPIENNLEKYYLLGVEYKLIDTLIENIKYKQYIEKQQAKDSFTDSEDKYFKEIQYYKNIQNLTDENIIDIFDYALSQNNNNFYNADKKLRKDLKNKYPTFIKKIIEIYKSLDKYDENCTYDTRFYIDNYLFNILPVREAINNILQNQEDCNKLFWYIINGCIDINDNTLRIIEEKFDLFIYVVKERIDLVCKEQKPCDVSNFYLHNTKIFIVGDTSCQKTSMILAYINFDKKNIVWKDFLKYIKEKEKKNPEYKSFFMLIDDIHNNIYFNKLKSIYKDIPTEKSAFIEFLNEFNKNDFYNDLDEESIKIILLNYYKFFNEDKVPTGKEYANDSFFNKNIMNTHHIGDPCPTNSYIAITKILGLLQNDKKYIPLLEELKKSENKNIFDSAEYCLLKLYEKQGKERDFDNNYYKDILDRNYKNKKNETFDYEKLRDDLIEISLIETKNRNAIFKESEDETNDRFRNALHYKNYNITDQSRGGESSTGINAGERDLVICNEQGLDESIIEAFILESLVEKKINLHYEKLIKRYDTVGNRVNFILVYSKIKNFNGLWKKYIEFDEFENFIDTKYEYSKKNNVRVGISKYEDMKIYHFFINFYSNH